MNQFIEVSIPANEIDKILAPRFLSLRIEGLKSSFYGEVIPESVVDQADKKLVSMSIQTEYHIIPLSVLGPGTICKVFNGHRPPPPLCVGQVTRRWFEPATRNSWRNLQPIPEGNKVPLKWSRTFTDKEYERVKLGEIPLSMDDHWFVYFEDDWLYYHRSWTGMCIFQVHIEKDGDTYRITEAYSNNAQDLSGVNSVNTLMLNLNGLCSQARIFD